MRRLAAIFILCLLPLQWSYAAIAEYCQHEETVAAQNHVGHHAHEHVDKSGDNTRDNTNQKKNGMADLDCPSCLHSTAFAILALPATALPNCSVAPILFEHQQMPDRSPENPFRPPLVAGL